MSLPEYLCARVAEGIAGFAEAEVDDIYPVYLVTGYVAWINSMYH